MKNILFIVAISLTILLCSTVFVSCEHNNDNSVKQDDPTIRTTITADEWNKHAQMNNYTAKLVLPDYTIYIKTSESAVQESYQSDDYNGLTYYVNDSGNFYEVSNYNGGWYKFSEHRGLPLVASMVDFSFTNIKFEDLIYDTDNQVYIGHFTVYDEEISTTYKFENGVIVSLKDSSPNWDYEAVYYITDIGTTEVELPQYTETSTYYGLDIMPNSGGFERVDTTSYSLPSSIKEAHRAINGGYVFIVEFDGYHTGNVAIIGVDNSGAIIGTKFIQGYDHMELFNIGYYNGVDLGTIDNVDIVSGCTISSTAYRAVIKDVLEAAKILN